MKEQFRPGQSSEILTHRAKTSYPKAGAVFMAEGSMDISAKDIGAIHPQEKDTSRIPAPEYSPESLRKAWYSTLATEELKNPDIRSSIEVAIKSGYTPKEVPREVVLENARLDNDARIAKVEEILGRKLSEEEEKIFILAHEVGKDEEGKNGEEAGVFNYKQKHIAKKARILSTRVKDENSTEEDATREAFDEKERRILMKAGLAGEKITGTFADPELRNIIYEINDEVDRVGVDTPLSARFIAEQIELVRQRRASNPASADEARILLQRINTFRGETETREGGGRGRRNLRETFQYRGLTDDAMDKLDGNDPVGDWLNEEFNFLYDNVQEGQEFGSSYLNELQQHVQVATQYLRERYKVTPEGEEKKRKLAQLDEFNQTNLRRLSLLQNKVAVGNRDIKQIQQAARALGTHNLLLGLDLEKSAAGSMMARLHEKIEDERLKKPKRDYHVDPASVARIQDTIIEEQFSLWKEGIGFFGDGRNYDTMTEVELEKKRSEIRRAVRTGYDALVSSQRMAVIVARGGHLTGAEAYYSDATGGPLGHYNLEDLAFGKFDMFNLPAQEMLEKVKQAMVADYLEKNPANLNDQEKADLGKRLFRDLFACPDFFSSGWRIKGIIDSITERVGAAFPNNPQRAEDFALFMQLKTGEDYKNERLGIKKRSTETMRALTWGKIAKFRPEEVVRLFRERVGDVNVEHEPASKELKEAYEKLFSQGVFANFERKDGTRGIVNYDDFKDELGGLIRVLRERGFQQIRQIDVGTDLKDDERKIIEKWYGGDVAKVGQVQEIFRAMTEFSNSQINNLMKHHKFTDIYTRTLLIDDALLDKLENPEFTYVDHYDENGVGVEKNATTTDSNGNEIDKRFIALSKRFSFDPGADALPRMWNDTEVAMNAGNSLIKFLRGEGGEDMIKAAMEFAELTSQYNGQGARAKCVRLTLGTYLDIAKKNYFWDVVGLDKLPFRLPMSELEEIYGPSAKPVSRDQLREQVDKIRGFLESNIEKETEDDKAKPWDERMKIKAQRKLDAGKMLRDLDVLLEVTVGDRIKLKAFAGLLWLILAAMATSISTVKDASSAELKVK